MSPTITRNARKRHKPVRRAASPRFILLDLPRKWRSRFTDKDSLDCKSPAQIAEAARHAGRDSLWIASRPSMIDRLIRVLGRFPVRSGRETRLGSLLMLDAPREKTLAILPGLFHSVIGGDSSFKTLPPDQLAQALSAPKERVRDVFIGGLVDTPSRMLALVRGDLRRLVVPFSIFRPSGTSKPDFRRFELDDCGQTIRLGDYEARADFVLFARDPDFRKRSKAERRKREEGFGPSLRRLRILRGLGRDDFNGLSPKTIARIERAQVQKPHGRTLDVICRTLDVDPDEIETY